MIRHPGRNDAISRPLRAIVGFRNAGRHWLDSAHPLAQSVIRKPFLLACTGNHFGPLPSSSAFGPLPSSRTSSSLFVVQHVDFHSSRKARACRGAYGLVGPSRTSAGVSAPNRSRLRSTNGLSCRLLVQKMLRHPHGTMPLPREWWLARVGGCLHPEPRGTSPHSSWGLRDPKVPWTSCPTLVRGG